MKYSCHLPFPLSLRLSPNATTRENGYVVPVRAAELTVEVEVVSVNRGLVLELVEVNDGLVVAIVVDFEAVLNEGAFVLDDDEEVDEDLIVEVIEEVWVVLLDEEDCVFDNDERDEDVVAEIVVDDVLVPLDEEGFALDDAEVDDDFVVVKVVDANVFLLLEPLPVELSVDIGSGLVDEVSVVLELVDTGAL